LQTLHLILIAFPLSFWPISPVRQLFEANEALKNTENTAKKHQTKLQPVVVQWLRRQLQFPTATATAIPGRALKISINFPVGKTMHKKCGKLQKKQVINI